MNKLLPVILFLTMAGVSVNGFADDDDDSDKVLVCHKGEKTLSLGAPGLKGHLGHGDSEGRCENIDDSTGQAVVVMMQCEANEGTVSVSAYSSSVAFAEPPLSEVGVGSDCADTLADLLNNGFWIKSVTGITEYLLLGESDD
jgi:hypothetical protein